ncbi:MAG: 30S ribosomal protein S3 [Anaerovoracaceae bacterium]|jgi:small subunit ribosomal protein S3
MGQKVSPHGFRVGVIQDWDSKWYADKKNFSDYLVEDKKIRDFVKKKLYLAGISRILIDRASNNQVKLTILAGKPGMIIGKSGAGIEELKKELEKLTGKQVSINIVEVRRTELDAQLTAESIASALERRVSFRRAMKQAIGRTMKAGSKGIKVVLSGRLGGAEIARSEKYSAGNVPLHTLRANIDYGFAEADTTYGRIGVKVWINQGEVLGNDLVSPIPESTGRNERRGRRRRNDRNGRGDRRDYRRNGRRGNDADEKKAVPIQRRKLKKKEAPAPAPQAEAEAPQVSEE